MRLPNRMIRLAVDRDEKIKETLWIMNRAPRLSEGDAKDCIT